MSPRSTSASDFDPVNFSRFSTSPPSPIPPWPAVSGVCASGRMAEDQPARPANVYGFSKALMENLARRHAAASPDFRIVGLRYFNVYGPTGGHKGAAASMG